MMTTPSFYYMVKNRLRGRNFLYEFYFKNRKTLDVGCGEGEFIRLDPSRISGLDANESVVVRLKREGLKAEVGNVAEMPYGDASFERLHCRNVIEHLPPEIAYKMLSECARVLESGGLLILASEVPTRHFWNTFGHTRPYPPTAVRKLLREHSREEFEPLGIFEYIGTFYLGQYFRARVLYFLSSIFAYYLPFARREYFMILRKKPQ